MTASVMRWNIFPDMEVLAYASNEQVPGPRLQPTMATGPPSGSPATCPNRPPCTGRASTSPTRWTAPPRSPRSRSSRALDHLRVRRRQAGTSFYHSHAAADRLQALGIYGALLVAPRDPEPPVASDLVLQLGKWAVRDGWTFPAMPMEGLLPNSFTTTAGPGPRPRRPGCQSVTTSALDSWGAAPSPIPCTSTAARSSLKPPTATGARGRAAHQGHRHRLPWRALRRDLNPRQPGRWLPHCHINYHLTNEGAEVRGGGGLALVIDVAP